MKPGRGSVWLALLAAFVLVLGACGGDDGESDEATDTTDDTAESTEETTADTMADETDETTDDTAGEAMDEASGEPIKIGALTSLTGPFASWGLHVEAGMKMAADDINAAGGVDGRMIEIISADDQSDAEEATVQYERLIEEGVVAVAGTISSGVGAATAGLAEEAQVPLFFSKAGSDALLTQSSRYTFRTCLPAGPMNAIPWGQYAQDQGFTKVGQIIADYAWGQSFKTASEGVFGEAGIELQTEIAPVPEQDFTTYLRSLDEFGPELLIATGHPPGSGPILAQAADLGLDVNVAGPGSSLTAVMEAAGDTAIGRYADHSCADYFSDDYAELATRYVAETGLGFMEDDAVAMYAVVNLLAEAVASAGDDPVAIADYVRGATYDSPGMAYPLAWTEWGELAQAQLVLVTVSEGPAPEGLNGAGDWWVEELFTSDPIPPYEPAS